MTLNQGTPHYPCWITVTFFFLIFPIGCHTILTHLDFHVIEAVWYLSLCIWFTSLNMMGSHNTFIFLKMSQFIFLYGRLLLHFLSLGQNTWHPQFNFVNLFWFTISQSPVSSFWDRNVIEEDDIGAMLLPPCKVTSSPQWEGQGEMNPWKAHHQGPCSSNRAPAPGCAVSCEGWRSVH